MYVKDVKDGKRTYTLYVHYRSGTVNSKSFVGKVLLQIKWKFELTYALQFEFWPKLRIRNKFELKLRIRNYFGLFL